MRCELSTVTVTSVVMLSVSKCATEVAPEGTMPSFQFVAVLQFPEALAIQNPGPEGGPPSGAVGAGPVRLPRPVPKFPEKNAADKVSPPVAVTKGADCCVNQAEVNSLSEFSSLQPVAGREKRRPWSKPPMESDADPRVRSGPVWSISTGKGSSGATGANQSARFVRLV